MLTLKSFLVIWYFSVNVGAFKALRINTNRYPRIDSMGRNASIQHPLALLSTIHSLLEKMREYGSRLIFEIKTFGWHYNSAAREHYVNDSCYHHNRWRTMVGLDIELSTDPLKAQSCNDLTILNKVLLYLIFDRDFFVWGFFCQISHDYFTNVWSIAEWWL